MIEPFDGYCRARITSNHSAVRLWNSEALARKRRKSVFAERLLLAIATSNEASRQKAGILEVVTKKLSNY